MLAVLSSVLHQTHRFEGCELDVRLYHKCMGVVPRDHNPNALCVNLAKTEGYTEDAEQEMQHTPRVKLQKQKQGKRYPVVAKEVVLIEVTWAGTSSPSVQEDLYLCFENKRVSGGGPIEKLTIDEQDSVAIIQFARPAGNSEILIIFECEHN